MTIKRRIIFTIIGLLVVLAAIATGAFIYLQTGGGHIVNIYRFNTRNSQLEPERRTVTEDYPEEMVQAVIRLLYEAPRNNTLRRTIPDDFMIDMIEEVYITGGIMNLFFTARYNEIPPFEEALLRSSLVHTMVGLPFINIEGVNILVEGEELINPFGESLGIQTQENVLINPPIMPRRVFNQPIILYFVNEAVDGLLPERRNIDRPDGVPVEQIIIEQLIYGARLAGRTSHIPADTRILDVRTEGGICFINLSAEFVGNFEGSQTLAELTLKSIVQSIMENQSYVSSIQFLIESERRDNFNGVPYFDTLFEREE